MLWQFCHDIPQAAFQITLFFCFSLTIKGKKKHRDRNTLKPANSFVSLRRWFVPPIITSPGQQQQQHWGASHLYWNSQPALFTTWGLGTWNNYWTVWEELLNLGSYQPWKLHVSIFRVEGTGAFWGTAWSGEDGAPEGLIHEGKANCHSWHPSISAHAIWVPGMIAATFPAAISLSVWPRSNSMQLLRSLSIDTKWLFKVFMQQLHFSTDTTQKEPEGWEQPSVLDTLP